MNEVERQKQQKQFIDTHNLGLDRERMMAKPTWTWFEFLAFMNFLDYQKIEQAAAFVARALHAGAQAVVRARRS